MNEEKSYVGMTTAICPVCGNKHTTGVAIHKHLEKVLPRELPPDAYEFCSECLEMSKTHLALVGVRNDGHEEILKLEQANRTGELAWLKHDVVKQVFNIEITTRMVFVDSDVIEKLKGMIDFETLDK